MGRNATLALALPAALCAPLLAFALPSQQVGVSTSDEGIPKLQLATVGGQNEYRVGERIPLQLSYTGPDNKQFELNMASYDRSGRTAYEKFEVTPAAGWQDPLAVYFGTIGGYAGGGLSSSSALSEKPTAVPLDLNEWVRFDRPGSYQVTVTSQRVTDVSRIEARRMGQAAVSLRSNSIELRILPATGAWQRAKLAAILSDLQALPQTQGIEAPQRVAAIADLRFLGTAAAAQIMAEHLREDETDLSFPCAFGLIGLPEKLYPFALAAMSRQVEDPHFPVSYQLLDTMSVLQLGSVDPGKLQERWKERERLTDANWELALQSLPAKEGKARAATAETLLNRQPATITAQAKASLGQIMASSLIELPAQKQAIVLEYDWDLLRSENLLPLLQQLAKTTLKNPASNESNIYSIREVKSAALQRWYELDPTAAHEEVLRQIGSAHPSLTAEAVAFLPREQLPQFESLWAEEFAATNDPLFAQLLARFGSGSAVALVRQKAEAMAGTWACAPQGAALAYLVEFDPESARPLVERAVQERGPGKTACNHSVFQDIALYATDPLLTQAAIASLDDPDPQVVMDALIYLISYGDDSARQPIWNRYVQWAEQWRGRGGELESQRAGSTGNWEQRGLGEDLGRALIENQGWLADSGLIASVLEKCVGEQMCIQLKQIADQASSPYAVVAVYFPRAQNFGVAQYSPKTLELLEAKLKQFPQGAKFSLANTSPRNNDQKQLEEKIKAIFEKNGLVLQEPEVAAAGQSR